MRDIKLYVYSRLAHNRIILTGFNELKKQNKITLTIYEKYNKEIDSLIPSRDIVECLIDDKIKVAFDMHDGYGYTFEAMDAYINTVDYYFKRSFSTSKNHNLSDKNQKKIFPLSFNWDVSYFSNPMEWGCGKADLKTLIKKFTFKNDIKYYENNDLTDNGKVLFMCRLWATDGSEDLPDYLIEERKIINAMRIGIIKKLKDVYGDRFVGGVEDTAFARAHCPELILPIYLTKKSAYIKEMKRSAVCIASTGLHQSIGWKFAEYVAAGRAIVSEKLNYEVIGDFEAGKNYLEYSTVDECLESVEKLLNDSVLLNKMKKANQQYYKKYARADKQMEYVIDTIK